MPGLQKIPEGGLWYLEPRHYYYTQMLDLVGSMDQIPRMLTTADWERPTRAALEAISVIDLSSQWSSCFVRLVYGQYRQRCRQECYMYIRLDLQLVPVGFS